MLRGERLPSSYGQRSFVDAGGLMCYAANFPDLHRRTAAYVDKLLKGARELGLTIPQSVLAQASEVIQ